MRLILARREILHRRRFRRIQVLLGQLEGGAQFLQTLVALEIRRDLLLHVVERVSYPSGVTDGVETNVGRDQILVDAQTLGQL